MQLKGELSSENEISRSKIDELQDQCQKLLRQNSSVLKSMATLEHDLDKGQKAHAYALLTVTPTSPIPL